MVWEKGEYLTVVTHGGRWCDSAGSSQVEFQYKKTHVWSASLFQGMAGPEQDLIHGHGPEQHLIHRQNPEGQRRSALTEIPQFGGLGRTGGAQVRGWKGHKDQPGSFTPHRPEEKFLGQPLGSPHRSPYTRGSPGRPPPAPGGSRGHPTRRGDSQPQQRDKGLPQARGAAP